MNINRLLAALICAGLPILAATGTPVPRTISVTFTVNSVADSVDANPGNGVCADASGQCSLRAAIMEANALAGPDTIVFDPITDGQPQLLQLHGAGENAAATGDLDITEGLTITGNGSGKTIIDGDNADRVFDIHPASGTITVEIDDLTVQNGNILDFGGGIQVNNATLVMNGALVRGNLAEDLSSSSSGGGIYAVSSTVTLDHTTVDSNTASAGQRASGGGIALGGSSTLNVLDGSVISNNTAGGNQNDAFGGGIYLTSGNVLTIDSSAVRQNLSVDTYANEPAYGGGIEVQTSTYSITNSEISNNIAHGDVFAFGGGLDSEYASADSSIVNTTITGNSAIAETGSAYGGGVDVGSPTASITEALANDTISANSVRSGSGSGDGGGLDAYQNSDVVQLSDTLIAGNTDDSGNAPDCFVYGGGTISSGGYNLIGDVTGCSFSNATGDQMGTGSAPIDPLLGALANNGGKTQTMALLAGSPAVDAGNPAGCKDASGATLSRDQRNYPRPTDGNGNGTATCDIGAYERTTELAPTASNGSITVIAGYSANGTLNGSAANGATLTFSIVSQPSHGTVTITNATTGAFTYKAASGYSGSDSFTFKDNDGFLDSGTASETVTVKSAPSSGGGGGGFALFALIALLLLALVTWWLRRRPHIGAGPGVRHLAVCTCVALALAGAPGLASALTFTVNSTADAPDAGINSVCDDGTGHCTLRAAVQEANGNPGADNIVFDASLDGKPIVLTLHGANENAAATGDLDITDDVTIDGRGSSATIIDGDAADRVFEVISGTLDLQHVTVQNGGAVTQGAGIHVVSGATLNLYNASVTDNHASGSGSGYVMGGGIKVDPNAFFGVDSSLISGNSAESSGGVAEGGGLDLEASNTVGITFTGITNNTATSTSTIRALGGGIHSTSLLTLQDSFVRGNTVHSDQGTVFGGGISIDVINASLTLSRVEISGNAADAPNGSAEGGAIQSASPVTLINTTVTNNTGDVAGIYQGGGLLTLVNATIYGNTGSSIGGVFIYSSASANLADTLIAGNTGSTPDCDTSGPATSYGYNLIGDTTNCTIAAATGDQFGTASNPINPELGPLTTGGQTHALPVLSNSPALDKGDPQLQSQGGTCQATDQLGNTRPADGNGDGTAVCDIGAVERGPNHPPQAANGSVAANANQATTGTLSATDADGDPLVFAVAQPAAHGTVSITDPSAGKFSYTPNQGYTGSDSFTFNASDGIDTSSAATETITVTAPPSSGGGGGGASGPLVLIGLLLLALAPWWPRRHHPITAGTAAPARGNSPAKRILGLQYLVAACAALIFGGMLAAVPAYAAPGDVDTTFNGGVPAILDLNPSGEVRAYGAAINPLNGDILWSGYALTTVISGGAITAYKPDGTLDTGVAGGSGEIVLTADQAGAPGGQVDLYAIAVDSQGRILASGVVSNSSGYAMVLARFKPDGTLDTGFGAGGTGVVTESLNTTAIGTSLALTSDGHILVTGSAANAAITETQLTVWRFNPDGTADTGFGDNGHVQIPGIAGAGLELCLAALEPDGALIAGFPSTSGGSWKITRLNPDGSVDTAFGASGFITGSTGLSLAGLALAPDGGFVISELDQSSSPPPIDLRRYLADGTVDSGFNGGNPLNFGTLPGPSAFLPVMVQPDGKIIASGNGGSNSLVVARLLADGTLDSNFGNVSAGISAIDFNNINGNNYTPGATALLLQGNGRIVASGYADSSAGSSYATFVTRVDNDSFTLTPAAFSFMNQTGVGLSTLITSNAISVSGLSSGVSVPVSVSGGEYQINSGAWTSAPGLTQNGDQIAVRHTSSGSYSTQTTTTLTIGGEAIPNNYSGVLGTPVSASFSSTTKSAPSSGGGGGGGGTLGGFALLVMLLLATLGWRLRNKACRGKILQ